FIAHPSCRLSLIFVGLPNGQLPVLEVDGYVLPQSMAILRYVGKLSGKERS
ncbi:unnamed protein product, partial [Laminaria digitata]